MTVCVAHQSSPPPFRLPAFLLLAFVLCTRVLAAQGSVALAQETRFTKTAGGQALGTLLARAEVTAGRRNGSAVEVTFEGWVRTASLGPTSRDGFDVVVTRRPAEALRRAPDGDSVARISVGAGFTRVETRGEWTRVRRTAWIAQKALAAAATPTAPVVVLPAGADGVELTRRAPFSAAPGGTTLGQLDSGTVARVLARSSGWTRVQVDAWVPDSALQPSATGVIVGVSQAEVRANPAKYLGQVVEWKVQFVALQKADELRPEIPEGRTYVLTRGPLPEPGFVYVIVPPDQVAAFEALKVERIDLDPVDRGEDVDPVRREANLEDDLGEREVLDAQLPHRSAELRQSAPDARGVLRARPHPEIEVARRTRPPVRRQGVGSDDEELSVDRAQRGQHVAEVAVHRCSPCGRPRLGA